MTDLSTYSFAQLAELRDAIAREIDARHASEVAAAKRQIQAIARDLGMTVDELLAAKTPVQRAKKETIYRHPTDETLSWTGHGRKPFWIHELEAGGTTLESLRVPLNNEAAA